MKVLNKWAVLLLSLFLFSKVYSAEVFFTPSSQCEDNITKGIKNAQKTIDVAVYSINNDKIVTSLISAYKKGIKIRVLTDTIQASGPSSKIPDLLNAGLDLKVHSVNKIMHNKFAIFDEKDAVNGSFNWTNPASRSNSENCVFFSTQEANIVAKYHVEFERLWQVNTAEKSTVKITKILEKKKNRALASKAKDDE